MCAADVTAVLGITLGKPTVQNETRSTSTLTTVDRWVSSVISVIVGNLSRGEKIVFSLVVPRAECMHALMRITVSAAHYGPCPNRTMPVLEQVYAQSGNKTEIA